MQRTTDRSNRRSRARAVCFTRRVTSPSHLSRIVRVHLDAHSPCRDIKNQFIPFKTVDPKVVNGRPIPLDEHTSWDLIQQDLQGLLPRVLEQHAPSEGHDGGWHFNRDLDVYLLRGDFDNIGKDDWCYGVRGAYNYNPRPVVEAIIRVYGLIKRADRIRAAAVHELGHDIRMLWRGVPSQRPIGWMFEEGLCESLVEATLGLSAVRHARDLHRLPSMKRQLLRAQIHRDRTDERPGVWERTNAGYTLGFWTVQRLRKTYDWEALWHASSDYCGCSRTCPVGPDEDEVAEVMLSLLDDADQAVEGQSTP